LEPLADAFELLASNPRVGVEAGKQVTESPTAGMSIDGYDAFADSPVPGRRSPLHWQGIPSPEELAVDAASSQGHRRHRQLT
jgi:hypothetical protein